MWDEGAPVFRFNFGAPAVANAEEPPQKSENLQRPSGGEGKEPTLPPPVEVLPHEVQIFAPLTPFQTDPVVFEDGFTLLKGRVSTAKVIGAAAGQSDRVPGKYEGGLKLWESTIDLVNCMTQEMEKNQLSFQGKSVLELGCGHGLPAIFALLKGATIVHFQDFNAEVLRSLTIPNVVANIENVQPGISLNGVHYFAGDWGNVHELLLSEAGLDSITDSIGTEDPSVASRVYQGGYHIILMAETVYSLSSLPRLYRLIKKCLRWPDGVLFVAAKKHYFGVGGGSQQFKALVDKDGALHGQLVTGFVDGASNVREIWKFTFKANQPVSGKCS